MKQIFKILSNYIGSIIMVIVLLVLLAQCDLALPTYTSNIVNVGIQQNGISDSVPIVISESTKQKLDTILRDDSIKDYYDYIDKDKLSKDDYEQYLKDYPHIEKENLYVLKDISDDERDSLNDRLETPTAMLSLLLSDGFDVKNFITSNSDNQTKLPDNITTDDLFRMFASMSDDEVKQMLSGVDDNLNKMGDDIASQMGIQFVKTEYSKVGIDVDHIQMMYILKIGVLMLLIAIAAAIINIIISFLANRVSAAFSRDLRKKVIDKVMHFGTKEFEDFSTASLITRCTNDIQQIQQLIVMLLRIAVYAPILGIGAFLKVHNSSMAWVIGVAVGVMLLIVIILFAIAQPKFQLVQKQIDKVNLVSREILTGLPVIRAFSTEQHEEERFDKANKNLMRTNLFVNRLMSVMMPTMMFVMNGVSVLIIWVGASKVDLGLMQVGDLMAFITYTMQIIMAFLMISMMSIMMPRAFVSIKRIGEIFNKDISVKQIDEPLTFDTDMQGVVEFKDVYFRYPDAEEDVLADISFKANKGETVAFIGSTGSGKSTLINLIPRFFDPTGGKILIDGKDITKVSLHNLRSKIGYVPQKGILFSGTIASNIKFGNDDLTDKEMKEIAEVAQSADFIEQKNDGFDSEIAQGGTNVSGGQKQRLSIARAIATKPEIYIFDDSFSALDYKTDSKLRKALKKYTNNSTMLIVAQRISSILYADKIVVLDQGRIAGIGTHKELLDTCEVYKEIAISQLGEEVVNNG